jgi:hypothetical protein
MEERRPGTPIDTLAKVIQESGVHANLGMHNLKDEESIERRLRLIYPLAITVSHFKWNPDGFSLAPAVGSRKRWVLKVHI